MNKTELLPLIIEAHQSLWKTAKSIPSTLTNTSNDGKWTVNENLDHINKSIFNQAKFFSIPKSSIGLKFGLANRASVSYDVLKNQYTTTVAKGVTANPKYIPEPNTLFIQEELIVEGKEILKNMLEAIQNWSEQELDQYFCPHPALGNITVRELLYFTIFHTQHHEAIIQRKFPATEVS